MFDILVTTVVLQVWSTKPGIKKSLSNNPPSHVTTERRSFGETHEINVSVLARQLLEERGDPNDN